MRSQRHGIETIDPPGGSWRAHGGRVFVLLLATAAVISGLLYGSPGRSGPGSLGSPAPARAEMAVPASAKPKLGGDPAVVTISSNAATTEIPRAFLGLSTEYPTLSRVELHTVLYERVLSLLHVPGDGRFVLRIGGDSADHAIFNPSATDQLPPWAFPVTPKLVKSTVQIINDLKLRVILDLNEISTTPHAISAWVQASLRDHVLPAGAFAAFEIGNEPDIYNRKVWRRDLLDANPPPAIRDAVVKPVKLPARITATSYARTYEAFAKQLGTVAPGAALAAPALAVEKRHLPWISTLLRDPHRTLRVVTAHVYPYSACAKPGQPTYPTVPKLLSETATAGMAKTIAPAVALARKSDLSVRLTEINSVTCGGVAGVSNAFVTSLWAPDALFELMRAGVEGVNLHARVTSINDPFYFTSNGLQTHPLLYGMILFTHMMGGQGKLVSVQTQSSPSLHLKVWATRQGVGSRSVLNVLVINKGNRSASVDLHLPASSPASVDRLLAPSAYSTSGVTLAGQQLDAQAQWTGKKQLETIRHSRRGYALQVRGQSAALLTVHIGATTLPTPPRASAGPSPLFGYE